MRDVKEKMWPALSPSEQLRTAVLMGGTVTLDQAFTADLLAEIRVLQAGQIVPEELRAEVQAEAADFAERTISSRTAAATAILDKAVAHHRAGLRLLGFTILFWLAATIVLIGGWL